jgi:PBSX family phage terminase large subunit
MEIKFSLLPKQTEFLEVPHDYNLDVAVYQGGYGSGKTFCGALLGILLCKKFPGIRGLVGAQTYPLVRDTTLQSYFEHLDNLGFVNGLHYNWRAGQQKLIFNNGSEILFRHFEEPNKLKSLNLGFVEIEECSDVPEDTVKILLSRLRQAVKPGWQGFRYRLFGHTNPEMSRGWIYKYFIEQKAKHPNYRHLIAPTSQNIHLPKDYVKELKSLYDESYYKINVLGEFGDYTSGLVVKNFTDDNVREIEYRQDRPLHISCDFNVDPMCWVLAHRTDDKVFYFDEIVIENTTTQRCVEDFIGRYGKHKGKIIINGDASGDNRSCTSEYTNYVIMLNALKAHFGEEKVEVRIKSFNPPIKNRVMAFNAKVKAADNETGLYIDPKCEKLLYNIYNLKYKEGTSVIDAPTHHQIKQNRDDKFLMHPFDAASYLTDFYWGIAYIAPEKPQHLTIKEEFFAKSGTY